MKRVVLISLILLSILGAVVLPVSCARGPAPVQPPTQPPPAAPPVAPLPEPEEGVYLSPVLLEAHPGEEVSIEIKVKPSGWGVSGCEVSLAFDCEVMTAVEIEPGGFLGTTPVIGLKRMDNGEGIIKIAMARRGETSAPSPPGILATIQFKVSDSAKSGTYELEVTKVGLADESFQDITEFTTQGASIKISS